MLGGNMDIDVLMCCELFFQWSIMFWNFHEVEFHQFNCFCQCCRCGVLRILSINLITLKVYMTPSDVRCDAWIFIRSSLIYIWTFVDVKKLKTMQLILWNEWHDILWFSWENSRPTNQGQTRGLYCCIYFTWSGPCRTYVILSLKSQRWAHWHARQT